MINIKSIQINLIHILGGITKEETQNYVNDRVTYYKNKGYKYAYHEIYEYVCKLNGLSKQEWIDKVYNYINKYNE